MPRYKNKPRHFRRAYSRGTGKETMAKYPVRKKLSAPRIYHAQRSRPLHGRLMGNVWFKITRGSIHMLRIPPAWAMDVADLNLAKQAGVRVVCIYDLEVRRCYWATLATILKCGFRLNRGFGEQTALPLNHWQPTRAKAEGKA
jgi:hypothetical protein